MSDIFFTSDNIDNGNLLIKTMEMNGGGSSEKKKSFLYRRE